MLSPVKFVAPHILPVSWSYCLAKKVPKPLYLYTISLNGNATLDVDFVTKDDLPEDISMEQLMGINKLLK